MIPARIETERLLLREWIDSDREPFAAMSRDAEVMRHFPTLLDRAQSDAMIDDRLMPHLRTHGFGLWAVERRSDGAFLGFTGLAVVSFDCPIKNEVEIGWRLARHAWGAGYATEAARAAVAHAFDVLGLPRIVTMTIEGNIRSRALMERLGMRRTPELDFEHPRIAKGDPTRPQIVHVLDAPGGDAEAKR